MRRFYTTAVRRSQPQNARSGTVRVQRAPLIVPASNPHVANLFRRGGIASSAARICFADTPGAPWVADDRDWFARMPGRSHRLRPTYSGEFPEAPAPPPDHALYAVVRQVEPGTRLRKPFFFNAAAPDPSPFESLCAALFDAVEAGGPGQVLTAASLRAQADAYEATAMRRPS